MDQNTDGPLAAAMAEIMQITDRDQLVRLRHFIGNRLAALAPPSGTPAIGGTSRTDLKVGDAVILRGLAPAYVNGTQGTITGWRRSRGKHKTLFTVTFDEPIPVRVRSRFGASTDIPPQCLVKVDK